MFVYAIIIHIGLNGFRKMYQEHDILSTLTAHTRIEVYVKDYLYNL